MSALQNAAARTDVAVIIDSTSGKSRRVSCVSDTQCIPTDNDVVANGHGAGKTVVGRLHSTHNRSILNVALRSDHHGVLISSDNGSIPHGRSSSDLDVSHDGGARGNISSRVDNGRLAVQGENGSVTRIYVMKSTDRLFTGLSELSSILSFAGATLNDLSRLTQNSARLQAICRSG